MRAPHASAGKVAVVVPLKSFGEAKARMASALDGDERRALAESMANNVLDAAHHDGSTAFVVTDDDGVAAWAAERDARVVRPDATGLDLAAHAGVGAAERSGYRRIVIAHGDLPLATTFSHLADRPEAVVLVADRRHDGTNVIVLDASCGFGFAYGPDSFARHTLEANRLGLTLAVVEDESLAWDVDVPDDLVARGRSAQ